MKQLHKCLEYFFDTREQKFLIDDQETARWENDFYRELYSVKYGYPKDKIYKTPELEDRLLEMAIKAGIDPSSKRRNTPTICLTHDIDYLYPTLQLKIKKLVRFDKAIKSNTTNYLGSISTLLSIDRDFLGNNDRPTLFVASPIRSKNLLYRAKQWLLDPSYDINSTIFDKFINIAQKHNAEIAIHGSFFSLNHVSLADEKKKLETRIQKRIYGLRQHWLNTNGPESFDAMINAGIKWDSTMGWNGKLGFRCGLANPFPIMTNTGNTIIEIPLLLMDGVLFDSMKLSEKQILELANRVINEVHKRSGCVAFNWHDRAADNGYRWHETYYKILNNAKSLGFKFKGISDSIEERLSWKNS